MKRDEEGNEVEDEEKKKIEDELPKPGELKKFLKPKIKNNVKANRKKQKEAELRLAKLKYSLKQ